MKESVERWLKDAQCKLSEQVSLNLIAGSSPLSSTWSRRFKGQPVEADRQARKALQTLKNENCSWMQLRVKLPNGQVAKIYISPDKNEKQVFTEQNSVANVSSLPCPTCIPP